MRSVILLSMSELMNWPHYDSHSNRHIHACLQEQLSDQYISNEWNESLDSVLRAEDDRDAALAALDALHNQWAPNGSSELCKAATTTNEQKKVEEELLELVAQLKEWRCIIGQPCTLELEANEPVICSGAETDPPIDP